MIKPIVKKNLYKEVFNNIIDMIKGGTYKEGDKIPSETELAESFGVSRNSVREALKSLDVLGVLISQSGIGTTVAKNATENIRVLEMIINQDHEMKEIWEARLMIEPELTAMAIQRATDEQRKEIKRIADESLECYEKDIKRWDLGNEFHDLIAKSANNTYIYNTYSSTLGYFKYTRVKRSDTIDRDVWKKEVMGHLEIAECFINIESEKGKKLMRDHLLNAIELLDMNN